jgi:hypothetical protein
MKLKDFLASLTSTNVQLTLTDLNSGSEIVSMKASGYASLDDTIEDREVKQWSILSATSIKVVLGAVVESEEEITTTSEP